MENQVFEAVRTVMAVREYADKELPAEVVRRIAEAAHLTASASNLQPWHFVVVRERDGLRKLGSMMRTGPYIAGAAAAVIVAYEKASRFGVSDSSRAIQSMILTAWGDGVGSNWAGFAGLEAVRKEFGLPDAYDVLAVAYLVRYAILIVLAITAPLAALLFMLPETNHWSKVWASHFVTNLLMQPAQLFVLAIGFALENGGRTPVHHLFALAALLIVFKVPGALGGTEKVAHKLQSTVHEAFTHIEHALVKA